MVQDRSGNLLLCSQNGLIAYNGRDFTSLGREVGLRDGGDIRSAVVDRTGRLAVSYDDQIRLSETAAGSSGSLETLSFEPVDLGTATLSRSFRNMVPWRSTVAVLADGLPARIDAFDPRKPRLVALPYDPSERRTLEGGTALFQVGGVLWEARSDGTLCRAEPGAVRCLGSKDGLVGGPWFDLVQRDDHALLARSATTLATIALPSLTANTVALPDQAGYLYRNYLPHLGLFRTPDGSFATQSSHGILLIGRGGIQTMDASTGIPRGVITSMMTDRSGQFWIEAFGRGFYRSLGFGKWDIIRDGEGLTDGLPWQVARVPGGDLWATTDTGLVTVAPKGEHLTAATRIPGDTFALAVDRAGRVWSSLGSKGLRVLDPRTGTSVAISLPPVNAVCRVGPSSMAVATEGGLFLVEPRKDGSAWVSRLVSPDTAPVAAMTSDGKGGLFYVSGGRLRHRRADGTDAVLALREISNGFSIIALGLGPDGNLWLGGYGGVLRIRLAADRVVHTEQVSPNGSPISTASTIYVDSRGWVWVGTGAGVFAFDGARWSLITTNDGLLWNDISQGGISEDTDGSMWVSTAAGVAHLNDPAWVFNRAPVGKVTATVRIGSRIVSSGAHLPFTSDPLTLQFGTPDFGAEQSIVFRYRLSGVDTGWTETETGAVRYPSIPFGRHVLSVYAYDAETRVSSPLTTIALSMRAPPWRRWWAEAGYVALFAFLIYGLYRLQRHVLSARQRELETLVQERTKDMRAAQVALERLAVTDGLTGLFNRSETERVLSEILAGPPARDMVAIALIDIDHFKQVNDRHGHLGGDAVLRAVGRIAAGMVGDGEFASRMGGEEFLLVFRGSSTQIADRIARFHERVRQTVIVHDGQAISVTCSIGTTAIAERDNWESLIGRADGALYRAKSAGRDRIVERQGSAKAPLRLVNL